MTLGQGNDTPLGHGQHLREILSRLDKGINKTAWPGHDLNRQMDRQPDRQDDSYIPPKLRLQGYNDSEIIYHVQQLSTYRNLLTPPPPPPPPILEEWGGVRWLSPQKSISFI